MKIAIVYDVIFPYVVGGMQLRNWEVARRLTRRGHTVTLIGTKTWPGPATIEIEGVRLQGVSTQRPLYVRSRRAFWPPIAFAAGSLPAVALADADVVDVSNFPYFPLVAASLATLWSRARLVMTWIEVWDDYWRDYLGRTGALAQWLERACARLPAPAAAISTTTARDLGRIGYSRPVTVIPCGVDVNRLVAIPRAAERTDILFAGRLIPEKGVDLLIEAVARLAPTHAGLRCTIIGDGPERTHLAATVEQHGLKNTIELVPFSARQSDLFARMKAARVLALPSRREGFGIVALEANACGLPVVTLDHPRNAARDLIRPGENGLTSAPDPYALADTLANALDGQAGGPDGCLAVAAAHDWEIITEKVEAFYAAHVRSSRRVSISSAA